VLTAVSAVIAVAAQTVAAADVGGLFPDMITKEPERFSIVSVSGELRLRFDNEVGDANIGPLEVVSDAIESDCDGDEMVAASERTAYQRIYNDDDGSGSFDRGIDVTYTDVPAGCVAYHDEHGHSHYQDFASYVLVRVSDDQVVSASSKVTFCMADVNRFRGSLPGSPSTKYYTSCDGLVQGISVGWSDEYPYWVSGQHVVLNPNGVYVGDGRYCLISTADPLDKLAEDNAAGTAEGNNAASIEIRLRAGGTRVRAFRGSSCGGVPPESW
jgi:hypothetical protein